MEGRFANAWAVESDEGYVGLFCCVVEGSSFYVARYVACVCGGGRREGVRREGVVRRWIEKGEEERSG
jgi:hypothetical protein